MIIFFLIATILTCFTLWIVTRIWTKSLEISDKEQDADWQVLLTKRNEIENDVLTPLQTQQALREEWTQMADAVLSRKEHAKTHSPALPPAATGNILWIAATSGALALMLYAVIGRWDAEALQNNATQATAAPATQRDLPMADGARHPGGTETIEDRIAKLEARLKESPGDLEGWVLLSRSRGIQRDFAGATMALEKALAIAPGHPDILADLADVSAMTNNKSLAGRPLQLIQQALQNAPDHRKALSLAATAAMQENKTSLAADYWKRLRATFPPEAPDVAQIDGILASLGNNDMRAPTSPAEARPATTTAVAGAVISGNVELSPALRDTLKKQPLPATAILYVVAKAPSGPPMPIAVARFPAQQLADGKTVSFQLDDSQAMTPALKLSASQEVNLEARISMAGAAGKQPGDLFVAISNVKVGRTDLRLVIQSVHP